MNTTSGARKAHVPSLAGVDNQFDGLFGSRQSPVAKGKLPCDECTACPHRLARIAADERAAAVAEGQMDLPIPSVDTSHD